MTQPRENGSISCLSRESDCGARNKKENKDREGLPALGNLLQVCATPKGEIRASNELAAVSYEDRLPPETRPSIIMRSSSVSLERPMASSSVISRRAYRE